MSLLVNLSGIGARATGLGVYAAMCGRMLEDNFVVRTLHNRHFRAPDDRSIESPEAVGMGAGRLAAWRRLLFLRSIRPASDTLVYTPSHHSLPHARHQIITIHDLISLHHPRQHPLQSLFFRFPVARRARRAAAVFTISEVVKSELVRAFDVAEDRIHIVPNSIDQSVFTPAPPGTPRMPGKPFLFCVGGRLPHKNVHELLERHAAWRHSYSVKVASCSGPYRKQLESLIDRLGLQRDVELLGYVSQQELVALYRSSAALVYPSKTEGFGIPPLEALACGSPVVVSDIPVHREVCGDAAFFVRLGSEASWHAAFDGLGDPAAVKHKLDRGAERLAHYSPAAVERALVTAVEAVAAQENLTVTRLRAP